MAISDILERLLWNVRRYQDEIKSHRSPENDKAMVKRKYMDKNNSQIQKTKEVQGETQTRDKSFVCVSQSPIVAIDTTLH